jgi:DUF1365 family protein
MKSALYSGRVRHRRFAPREHAFTYRLFQLYLDLDELDHVFAGRWLWSVGRRNLAAFHREDYLGDRHVPLKQAVLDTVEESIGRRPEGPVRVLTHLRFLGLCFNPVTFYYCFEADGETLDSVVAEITNTPWKQRHSYVLERAAGEPSGGATRWSFPKDFHVSPFMPMEQSYQWWFTAPHQQLLVQMENHEQGSSVFDATLTMRRRPISARSLAGVLFTHPWMTGKALAGIYLQAARLFLKRIPVHHHPKHRASAPLGDPS